MCPDGLFKSVQVCVLKPGSDAKLARPFLLNPDISSFFFRERWEHVLVPGFSVAPQPHRERVVWPKEPARRRGRPRSATGSLVLCRGAQASVSPSVKGVQQRLPQGVACVCRGIAGGMRPPPHSFSPASPPMQARRGFSTLSARRASPCPQRPKFPPSHDFLLFPPCPAAGPAPG